MPIHINVINIEKDQIYVETFFYQIFLFNKQVEVIIDSDLYTINPPALLFLRPNQYIEWKVTNHKVAIQLKFIYDLCHKDTVLWNELLFNNTYPQPYINIDIVCYEEIKDILFLKIEKEINSYLVFSQTIIKSYLEIILALSGRAKRQFNTFSHRFLKESDEGNQFLHLIESNFLTNRDISFYAGKLNCSIDSFSRKIKKQLGKTPSELIKERVILEAKKYLRLTNLSVKEIAIKLNFDDENYFSRFFKKNTGISPSGFRIKTPL